MDAPGLAEWLKNRLRNAEDDWRGLLTGMYEHLLTAPFERVADRAALRALVEETMEVERIRVLVKAVFEAGVRPAIVEGRADGEPIGRWMPEDAQRRLEALVADNKLINEAWIEQLFAQEAAEELAAETLYQSLKDFSTLVPRVLQKVLPSGLGRLAGFAANAGGKVFDEVERVLDGEIKRFLEKGTRRALDRAARFTSQNMDSPTAVKGRRNLVRFVLSQSGQFHVEPLTDERLDAIESIVLATAAHAVARDEARTVVDRVVEKIWSAHSGRTVGEVLSSVGGLVDDPPLDAWARATWPILREALDAPAVDAWLDQMAAEFFATPTP